MASPGTGGDPLGMDGLAFNDPLDHLPLPDFDDLPLSEPDDLPLPQLGDLPSPKQQRGASMLGGGDFPVPKQGRFSVPPMPSEPRSSSAHVPLIGEPRAIREPLPPKVARVEPFGAKNPFDEVTGHPFENMPGASQQAYAVSHSAGLPRMKSQDAFPAAKRSSADLPRVKSQDAFPAAKRPPEGRASGKISAPEIPQTTHVNAWAGGKEGGSPPQDAAEQYVSKRSGTHMFIRRDQNFPAPKAFDAAGVPIVHRPTAAFLEDGDGLLDALNASHPLLDVGAERERHSSETFRNRQEGGIFASIHNRSDYDINNDSGLPLNDDPLGMMHERHEQNKERSGLKLDFPTNLETPHRGERHENSGLLSVGRAKKQDVMAHVPPLRERITPSQMLDELDKNPHLPKEQENRTLTSGLINYSEIAKQRNHEAADMLGLLDSIQSGQLTGSDKGEEKASRDDLPRAVLADQKPEDGSKAEDEEGNDDEMAFDLSSIKIEKDNTIASKLMLAEDKAEALEKKKRRFKRVVIMAVCLVLLLAVVAAIVTVAMIARKPVDEKELAPAQVIQIVEMTQEKIAKDSLRDYRAFFQTSVQNNDAVDMTPEKRLDNQGMVILNTVMGAARFKNELEDQIAMIESSVVTLEAKDMCKGGWCALGLWSWAVYREDAERAQKYEQYLGTQTDIPNLDSIQKIVKAIAERQRIEAKKNATYDERIASYQTIRDGLGDVSGWPLADYLYSEACMRMGDMEEASKRLEPYADKIDDVSYAGVTMLRAELDYLQNRYERADALAQKVIDLDTGETQQIIRAKTLALRAKASLLDWNTFVHEVLEDNVKLYAHQPVLLATVADICIQKGHADNCRILYQALIDGDPENTDVRQQHARLYVYAIGIRNLYLGIEPSENVFTDLAKSIDVAVKMNTDDIQLWIYRALSEYAQKNYKMALEAAMEAERGVDYEWVHHCVPLIQKKLEGEEYPFRSMDLTEIAKNAYTLEDYFIVGEMLNVQQKYQASLALIKRALKIYPQDARLWDIALRAAIALKDKEMVKASTSALQTQKAITSYHQYSVARFINDIGEPDEALKRMSVIISQEPTNPTFLFYIGQLYLERGNFDSASHYFEKTMEFDSSNPEAYFYAGRCYYELKDYTKALSSFTEARSKSEMNATYALWIGNAQAALKMDEDALRSYSVVIDTRAPNGVVSSTLTLEEIRELAHAFQGRGLIHASQQRRKEAQKDFSQAEKLAPENMQYIREYVVFLYETGKTNEALSHIQVLKQKHEMDAVRYYVEGLAYLQLGQRNQALTALETAHDKGFADLEQAGIASVRDSAEIYERLGYMYRDIGRKKDAARMLKKYIEKAKTLSDRARREIEQEIGSM